MSVRESREDVLASPFRARSLLTVRAAISSALSFEVPRSRSPSLMCSYCRSRFALHACCGIAPPFAICEEGRSRFRAGLFERWVLDVVLRRVGVDEGVDRRRPLGVRVVDL